MYDPNNVVVKIGDVIVTGFDDTVIEMTPRKWWREDGDGYRFVLNDNTHIHYIPVDKQDFFDKHLKNLEDSVESPFTYRETTK